MAISFIGVGTQVAGNTGTPITPPLPSGWQADDLAVLVIVGRPDNDSTTEPGPASGWDKRAFRWFDWGGTTFDLAVVVWTRVLQSGDTAPSITLSGGWAAGGSSVGAAAIAVYRGVDTTTPMDATPVTGESGSQSSSWTPPSITTTTADAWVLSIVGTGDNSELALLTANGFTARMSGADYDSTVGADVSAGLADYEQASAGAATMPEWDQTVNDPDFWVGATLALRPAGGAATVNAIAAASWGGWSATATAAKTVNATATGTWGGWAATATATNTVDATAAASWGGWSATGSATVSHDAIAAATWDGWAATATATNTVNATATGTWGDWSAEAAATRTTAATAAAAWGGWSATASANVEHPVTAEGAWGGWAATAAAEVTNDVLASATGAWGGWAATAAAAVSHDAAAAGSWGAWAASASAIVTKKATAAASWGEWTATAGATVSHDAAATGTWDGWAATAAATRTTTATAAGSWQGWVAGASALAGAPVGTAQFASGQPRRRFAAAAVARRTDDPSPLRRRYSHNRLRRSP